MAEMIASVYKNNSVDGEWLINQIKDTFVDHFGEYATWKMKDFLNYILKAGTWLRILLPIHYFTL